MPVRIAPGVRQEWVEKELEARAPVTVERQMEETLLGGTRLRPPKTYILTRGKIIP